MSTQSQKNNEQILILNGKIKLLDQKIDLLMNNRGDCSKHAVRKIVAKDSLPQVVPKISTHNHW